jgi:hypothetical protein
MKFPISLLIIGLFLMTLVAADPCSLEDICKNSAGEPYCNVDETSCEYTFHTLEAGECVVLATDSDTDMDGWSDSCDAFPELATEVADLDGDLIGHNTDCDDLDDQIGVCLDNEIPLPQEDEKENKGRALSNEGIFTLKIEEEVLPVEEEEQETVFIETTSKGAPLTEEQEEINAEKNEETNKENLEKERRNQLTGYVVDDQNVSLNLWLPIVLLLFIIAGIGFIIYKKRR